MGDAIVEQPEPHGTGAVVVDAVVEDLRERQLLGIERYGEPLRAHNGRNALVDAYQEVLDLACYLKQVLMEDI